MILFNASSHPAAFLLINYTPDLCLFSKGNMIKGKWLFWVAKHPEEREWKASGIAVIKNLIV